MTVRPPRSIAPKINIWTDNSTALSGFAGDYVFSVLINGDPVSWIWSRTAEDRFATALARG